MYFEVVDNNQIRLLDPYGKAIASELPYELARTAEFASLPESPLLNGMFSYYADAPRITECKTGRSFPVAMEREYIALERDYSATINEPGQQILVSFAGSIEPRAMADGQGSESTVVVDRHISLWPMDSCSHNKADAALRDTYWKIVRLGNKMLEDVPGIREPRVILRSQDDLYSATVGCNSMSGGYSAAATQISFRPGRTTLMACLPPVSPLERALVETLQQASSWDVAGQTMEFSDAGGEPIALFKAVFLQ
jgi:heat shock protein HslJ